MSGVNILVSMSTVGVISLARRSGNKAKSMQRGPIYSRTEFIDPLLFLSTSPRVEDLHSDGVWTVV